MREQDAGARTVRYHVGRVRAVEPASPTVMRVLVEDLRGFPTRAISGRAVGETVRVVLPDPDTGRVREPDLSAGKPRWAKPSPRTRKYTVRRADPEAGTVELQVVAHGRGPGSRWAQTLAPGDPVHLLGPKSGYDAPQEADFLLLAGDETGLPGIARWLEDLPADAVGRVLLEVPGTASVQQLKAPPGMRVTWLVPGDPSLAETVAAMERPAGRVFAWLAGESTALRPVRRHLMEQWGLDKRSMHAKGYWNRTD